MGGVAYRHSLGQSWGILPKALRASSQNHSSSQGEEAGSSGVASNCEMGVLEKVGRSMLRARIARGRTLVRQCGGSGGPPPEFLFYML